MLGAGMVGVNAGELIAETVHALEMGADAEDIGLTIHPHPTLSETVGFAAEAAEGTITDLYMPKRGAKAGVLLMAIAAPSASYSITIRARLPGAPGRVRAGGGRDRRDGRDPRGDRPRARRARDQGPRHHRGLHRLRARRARGRGGRWSSVTVESVSDRTFLMHLGRQDRGQRHVSVKTRDDLSMAYTPGRRARLQRDRRGARARVVADVKGNTVAVVSDGTAVLGLGDIGPEAAMPVMEGKALLFKEFAGVDAFPLCIDTTDVEEIIAFVTAAAPTFGGINLEDIAAPRCFEIERRLRETLDIPVFHDDQHGTAIVTLAALLNALRVVGKAPEDVRVVVTGAGAAGMACTKIMLAHGIEQIVVCDIDGVLYRDRPGLDPMLPQLAERTNPLDGAAAPTSCSPARTSTSACPAPAPSRPRRSARWRRARSCSRWPTRRRR